MSAPEPTAGEHQPEYMNVYGSEGQAEVITVWAECTEDWPCAFATPDGDEVTA